MRAPRTFLHKRAPIMESPMRLIGRGIVIGLYALASIVALSLHVERVAAAGYIVNVLTDTGGALSGTPGDLRYAIAQVNAGAGTGDTITITATGTILLGNNPLPEILKPVAITGPGATTLTISGHNAVKVFTIHTGITASISNLTIANGNGSFPAGSAGGGINNSGTLTVTNSALSGNGTVSDGGGIYNVGALTVTNSTLSGNSGTGSGSFGGGIHNRGGTVTVTNSTLTGNSANSRGGGIYNRDGTVMVTNSILSSNTSFVGGGIYNDTNGTVTIMSSTLSGNSAHDGGSIQNADTVTVANSTFSGNSTTSTSIGTGGGVIDNGGTLTMTNSTLSGNSANVDGGGILNFGTATVTNCTIAGNSATGRGGGIFNFAGTLTATNVIVAGNTAMGSAPDIGLAIVSHGHNLIGNTSGGSGFVASDLTNVAPMLGPLASNGGLTQTRAVLPGSPAIGAGDAAVCSSTTTPPGAPVGGKDQRGLPRPTATCAIGAFEPQVVPTPAPLPPLPAPTGPPQAGLPAPLPNPKSGGGPGGSPNPLPQARP